MSAPQPISFRNSYLEESDRSQFVERPLVAVIFGTRPEAIKLRPILQSLGECSSVVETTVINSGQHDSLLRPFLEPFGIRVDCNLSVMTPGQSSTMVCARVMAEVERMFKGRCPDLTVVQGDTSTAFASALASFQLGVPVAHVEAGLRSFDHSNPFPEEMNRTLISRLSTFHFAATENNVINLLSEGVDDGKIFLTGNPVVDSLQGIRSLASADESLSELLNSTRELRRVVITTHRRESFDSALQENLGQLRRFVDEHEDVVLIFPVHPNPNVKESAARFLSDHPRIRLIDPMPYDQFVCLLQNCWLIVSDSGGVQEEAPTLGKPLLILRKTTERPEVIECGVARLAGQSAPEFFAQLQEAYREGSWTERVSSIANPFGDGKSGKRISDLICELVGVREIVASCAAQ